MARHRAATPLAPAAALELSIIVGRASLASTPTGRERRHRCSGRLPARLNPDSRLYIYRCRCEFGQRDEHMRQSPVTVVASLAWLSLENFPMTRFAANLDLASHLFDYFRSSAGWAPGGSNPEPAD